MGLDFESLFCVIQGARVEISMDASLLQSVLMRFSPLSFNSKQTNKQTKRSFPFYAQHMLWIGIFLW
jgi:hypothetical protein